jgi:hypothetical protein
MDAIMNNTTERLAVALQALTRREREEQDDCAHAYGNHSFAKATVTVAVNNLALSSAVSQFLRDREEQVARMRDVSVGTY